MNAKKAAIEAVVAHIDKHLKDVQHAVRMNKFAIAELVAKQKVLKKERYELTQLLFTLNPKSKPTPVELVLWEDVRQAMKYPVEDNNKGLIYGINVLTSNNLEDAEVLEVFWFKSAEARSRFIKKNNFTPVNETT